MTANIASHKVTMVNTESFSKRLNKVMEYYDLSAAGFADKIEVGRSSISHILSGRNKPSLEFVMKVVKSFPEVELYWLLNGKGSFPKTSSTVSSEMKDEEIQKSISATPPPNTPKQILPLGNPSKNIQKIVIFYSDGTFDAFEN